MRVLHISVLLSETESLLHSSDEQLTLPLVLCGDLQLCQANVWRISRAAADAKCLPAVAYLTPFTLRYRCCTPGMGSGGTGASASVWRNFLGLHHTIAVMFLMTLLMVQQKRNLLLLEKRPADVICLTCEGMSETLCMPGQPPQESWLP